MSRSQTPVLTVGLVGGVDRPTAFANQNRSWTEALGPLGVDFVAADDRRADVILVSDYSLDFTAYRPPSGPPAVAVRPWDFGPYPPAFVEVLLDRYAELWALSDWSRAHAIEGGLPPGRVRTVRPGVDTSTFSPTGPRHPAIPDDVFVIGFVGAAVHRKGADVLLEAYRAAFGPADPVALVVKDRSGDVFYADAGARDLIRQAARDRAGPRVLHLDADLVSPELASVYRSFDVAVHPYRAEGFGFGILEAMASGVPVVVPTIGPAPELVTDASGWLAETRRIRLPVDGRRTFNTLGFDEHVVAVDFAEVSRLALAGLLRELATGPRDEVRRRGRGARSVALEHDIGGRASSMLDALVAAAGTST